MEVVEETGCRGRQRNWEGRYYPRPPPPVRLATPSPLPLCLQHPAAIVTCDIQVGYSTKRLSMARSSLLRKRCLKHGMRKSKISPCPPVPLWAPSHGYNIAHGQIDPACSDSRGNFYHPSAPSFPLERLARRLREPR
jgi:hypothetical protein